MLEVEVKVRIENCELVKEELLSQGFACKKMLYEKDVYFNSEINDLKAADKAVRIREYYYIDSNKAEDSANCEKHCELNYKGPKIDNITMAREEVQFDIPSFSTGERMLNGLGYYSAGLVEKVRAYYINGNVTCCVDMVTGLGSFMEIEIMSEESCYADAVAKIEEMLQKLGLSLHDTIRESYLCMLEKQ